MKDCISAIQDALLHPSFAQNAEANIAWLKRKAKKASGKNYGARLKRKALAYFSAASKMRHWMKDANNIKWLLRLSKSNWTQMAGTLETMRKKLLNRDRIAVDIAADSKTAARAIVEVQAFIDSFTTKRTAFNSTRIRRHKYASFDHSGFRHRRPAWLQGLNFSLISEDMNFTKFVDTQTADNLLVGILQKSGDIVNYKFAIPVELLSSDYVYKDVRGVGGAYGGKFALVSAEGLYSFQSNSDPHVEETFQLFRDSGNQVTAMAKRISHEEVEQHILSHIAKEDSPREVEKLARESFLDWAHRFSQADRQHRRDQWLKVTRKDYLAFGKAISEALIKSPHFSGTYRSKKDE